MKTKKSRSPLLFIFLTVFIDLLGFGIVIPLLPIYSKTYGASIISIVLLMASSSAMQLVFAPLWGRVSDRIGRKPVLIGGLIGTSLSYMIFAFADSMTLLFVSRILAGFFGANVTTAHAYIADVTSPENRAKGMGIIGAAFGLGFTFGPLLGGELTALSTGMPGFFASGLSLIAATFGFFHLQEPEKHRDEPTPIFHLDQVREALGNGRIGILYLLYFWGIFSLSCFESIFILFGLAVFPTEFNIPEAISHGSMDDYILAAPIAGRYLFAIGVIAAIVQGGLIRKLVPKFGETKLAIAGPLFLGISFAIMGLATSWWMVVVGCIIMPLGFGLNNPSLNGLISRATPEKKQGAYLGLGQSVGSLARITGPLVAGSLFVHFGPHSPFLVAAGILFLASLLAARYRSRYGSTFG